MAAAPAASARTSVCSAATPVSDADLAQAEQQRPQRLARIRSYLAARAAAAKGDRDAALSALQKLAATGIGFAPGPQDPLAKFARDPAFVPVFGAMRQRFDVTANGRPVIEAGRPPVAAESLAYDPSGRRFYLSNWFDNSVYRLTPAGRLTRYLRLPDLTPNGVKIDAARHRLWFVATNAFRDGAAEPRSELWRVDLLTGAKSSFAAAGAKGFNDLAIAPNGDVFVTDTPGGAIFVLRAGARELQPFLPDEKFQQPNGIALDERGRFLFVAQGLDLLRIDLLRSDVAPVRLPAALETIGTDGLAYRNGKLYAIQNLVTAGAVLEIKLDKDRTKATAYRILDRANPHFDLPTSGTFARGRYYVLARTQLYLYGRGMAPNRGELKPLLLLSYPLCN